MQWWTTGEIKVLRENYGRIRTVDDEWKTLLPRWSPRQIGQKANSIGLKSDLAKGRITPEGIRARRIIELFPTITTPQLMKTSGLSERQSRRLIGQYRKEREHDGA